MTITVKFNIPEIQTPKATFDVTQEEYKAVLKVKNFVDADHSQLYNRDQPDQHPISAITGLQEALDAVVDPIGEATRLINIEKEARIHNDELLSTAIGNESERAKDKENEIADALSTTSEALSSHTSNKNNPHQVTKAQVGLGNVDNTSDLNKPISTATQNALNSKVSTVADPLKIYGTNALGQPTTYDYESLGKVDDVKVGGVSVVSDRIAQLGTMASETASQYSKKSVADTLYAGKSYETTINNHIANKSNPHAVTKAQVGLGNVNNTSDADKPISYATQVALDTKQATITGAATTITSDNLTANKVLISNGSGKVSAGNATSTELGYLVGATSPLQSQIGTLSTLRTTNKSSLVKAINEVDAEADTNTSDITTINSKIPDQASSSNKLADKNFVNSSIASSTANFIGTFNSVAELEEYSGTVTINDYAFVVAVDGSGNTVYNRYKYTGTQWLYEYTLNNSSFTAAQWASINSGITEAGVLQINTNKNSIGNLNSLSTTSKTNTVSAINELNNTKQDNLVSGRNIKTINNQSVIGVGNINIDSLPNQTGNANKYLTTNGSAASWVDVYAMQIVDYTA